MSLLAGRLVYNHSIKRNITGVTLIELLVVIVLLGISITLVAPFTFKQIESSQARNEHLFLQRWLQKQSFSAFTSQSNIAIRFDGKAIYSVVKAQISPLEQQLLNNDANNNDTTLPLTNNQLTTATNSHFKNLDDYLQYGANQDHLTSELTPTHTFNFIFFEPQMININHHGYFDTAILTYRLRGVIVELNVLDLIEGASNEP